MVLLYNSEGCNFWLLMSQYKCMSVLLARSGQLSGDGQLRESIYERRDRKGKEFPLWFLPGDLVMKFSLGGPGFEAVVAEDPTVITWLQLRFGGKVFNRDLSIDQLSNSANLLPPEAPLPDLNTKKCGNCDGESCSDTNQT